MARKIVSASALVAGLLVVTPALAQRPQWSADRPDGHAPVGVMADYTLEKGELYVGGRYYRQDFLGTLVGTTPFLQDEVLDFFSVAPLSLDREIHELELRYGLSDDFTLSVSMPFIINNMLSLTEGDEFFETTSNDIGDLSVRVLIDLFEMDLYRMHALVGATVPLGQNLDTDVTPSSGTGQAVLPFPMQTGAGHPDLLGGLAFMTQNEVASVGAQANVVIRAFDNDRGYRLGDRFEFTVWGAHKISDWLSVSARGLFESVGETEGFEPLTDGNADPSANPFAQGGERFYMPLGVNLYFQEGLARGHRIAFEWYYTVHEDLNGPQLSVDKTVVVSWQIVFF